MLIEGEEEEVVEGWIEKKSVEAIGTAVEERETTKQQG